MRKLQQVRLRNSGKTFNAIKAFDKSSYAAVASAKELLVQRKSFSSATVDRFDGLVLVGPDGNWHFATALCGYRGSGPMATAEILELFGFGKKDDILWLITNGDDHATFSFSK